MTNDAVVNDVINPITALAFTRDQSGNVRLLLVGEGPYLKVYDDGKGCCIAVKRVFETQAIHSIITIDSSSVSDGVAELLIWGGRWVRPGFLRHGPAAESSLVEIEFKAVLTLDDWALGGCFTPTNGLSDEPKPSYSNTHDAIVLTAHNVAYAVLHDRDQQASLKPVAAGPDSLLYSAHVESEQDGRILVASGTVLGEILLWSFPASAVRADVVVLSSSQLLQTFTGHEGSVFGIRISPDLSNHGFGDVRRLIASCSDDRTIRLWDISDLGTSKNPCDVELQSSEDLTPSSDKPQTSTPSTGCVASIMGHASRIWDIRFLRSDHETAVISFGEDSTTQVWQLTRGQSCLHVCQPNPLLLSHKHAYAYHSGKSIWASTLVRRQDGSETVCTGGADGRIVQYDVLDQHGPTGRQAISSQCTMQDIALQLAEYQKSFGDKSTPPGPIISKSICEHVFDALGGAWTINREINSALPTCPSGQFSGEAQFARRPPTALGFEKEYLYNENGKFITDQSLNFPATRRYVYRYQQASDSITAWFVKPDDNTAVDYLFHEVRLDDGNELSTHGSLPASCVIKASSYHLCGKDHYTPTYILQLTEGHLEQWKLVYSVKGPQKDYTAEASYYKERKTDDLKPNAECSAIPRSQKQNEPISLDYLIKKDNLRSYVFLTDESFLVTTAQGRVLVGTLLPSASNTPRYEQGAIETTVKWRLVGQYETLKSSSIITRANGSDLILLGGNDGTMSFYDRSVDRILPMKHLNAKLAFLYALKLPGNHPEIQVHVVLDVCLGIPAAYVYKFSDNDHHGNDDTRQPTVLSLPAYFVVTSSCYLLELRIWMLGSRSGVIAFYNESMSHQVSMLEPCSIFTDIHGQEAITVIQPVPYRDGNQPSHVLTAGRDGHYAVHKIVVKSTSTLDEDTVVILKTVHRSTPTFGPNIEGAAFDNQRQELIMWGFRSKEFVVWNATKDMETMSVDCGGAHRNWCYRPRKDGSNGGTFVWTKASVCHVHSQVEASHRVISSGGHGREIRAMATSPVLMKDNGAEIQYTATGAEDTIIKIWSIDEQGDQSKCTFRCLGTFTKHMTGIQQLRWSADGSLLFSAAGCEEFFVWRVQSVPYLGVGALCEAICQRVTNDGDLRVMDFAITEISRSPGEHQDLTERGYIVTIVYSNSSIRVSKPSSLWYIWGEPNSGSVIEGRMHLIYSMSTETEPKELTRRPGFPLSFPSFGPLFLTSGIRYIHHSLLDSCLLSGSRYFQDPLYCKLRRPHSLLANRRFSPSNFGKEAACFLHRRCPSK